MQVSPQLSSVFEMKPGPGQKLEYSAWHGCVKNPLTPSSFQFAPVRIHSVIKKWGFFSLKIELWKVPHSPEHFSVIRPQSLSFFFLKGMQLAEDLPNVLSRSSSGWQSVWKTCDVPRCYPQDESHRRNLKLPVKSITWISFDYWCHSAVCSQ